MMNNDNYLPINRHNANCKYPTIAPQALPQSGNKVTDVPFHYESFDGKQVNYSQVNQLMHRHNQFPMDSYVTREFAPDVHLGLYNSNLVCSKGTSNIDNDCMCPGSTDSMPFNSQTIGMNTRLTNQLFSPFLPNAIPELTNAAQINIKQRQQLPSGQGSFYDFDLPLPCNRKY